MKAKTETTASNLVQCSECGQWVYPNQFHSIDCCNSFKAGIKEVAELEAKLKEWGIEK